MGCSLYVGDIIIINYPVAGVIFHRYEGRVGGGLEMTIPVRPQTGPVQVVLMTPSQKV